MVSSRAGQAEPDIVIFVRALPVDADAAQRFRKLGIVGEDRAAIAEAAKRFGREKAGRGCKAEGAEAAALIGRAECLCGVVEHEQALGLGNCADGVMVGALSEQIDRDHGLRLQAELLCGRDAALQRSSVHVEGRFIDIDEDRRGARQRHNFAGRAERERRADDRIAAADALGHQHHQQRIGAAGAGHDMPGAAECRERRPRAASLPGR